MRAWHCFCGNPCDGSLLVIAETRNRAKVLASRSVWEWEYIDISVRAANPVYDDVSDHERIVETNDDLPSHSPPFPSFYNDVYS